MAIIQDEHEMNKTDVIAIIVTYNRLELLKRNIASVLSQQNCQCDLLVVDNASTDGTKEYLEIMMRENSRLQCLFLAENTGGAGGFHHGIKTAFANDYRFFWLMDDDTIPNPDCLQQLMKANDAVGGPDSYGFLSSAVFWVDGKACLMNRPKIKKNYYEKLEYLKAGLVLIEQATFVSLLLPRETILKAGLPIKEYFIWGDDIEYTRRIAVRLRIPSYLVGTSTVVHHMSNNEGSSISKDDIERINRYNYAFRNENHTYRKEGVKGFLYYTGKCTINIFRSIKYAKNHRLKRIGIIVKNYFLGIWFNPRQEYIDSGNDIKESIE